VPRKVKTVEQVEAMLKKAEQFARNVLGDPEKAQQFADMDVVEYASRKGIQVQNTGRRGGSHERTETVVMTKPEMESLLDEVDQLLQGALDPTLTREELVERVIEVAELVGGEDESEAEESEEEDESDDG
jgi:hypothetical protein